MADRNITLTVNRTTLRISTACMAVLLSVAKSEPSSTLADPRLENAETWPQKLTQRWKWLRLGGELRSRLEAPTGQNLLENNDDSYLMTRVRVNASVKAGRWLRFLGEWQDVHAYGHDQPVPGGMTNRLDLRQAIAEIGAEEGAWWSLSVGRQALKYGKGRLVGDPDWGNFGQTFDAARLSLAKPGFRLDAFAGSVVVPRDRFFDRSNTSNMLYGLYGSTGLRGKALRLEPYLILKSNARVSTELGDTGALDLRTAGARAAGSFTATCDWEIEMAFQAGSLAGRPVSGFGGVWSAGWQSGDLAWQPRIFASYTYGSGDSNPRDGRKETFDTLYPSVHLRNGATDRIGWANIHDVSVQADWKVSRNLKLSLGGHDFRLANLQDALYYRNGAPVLRNPTASSQHVGAEMFGLTEYQLDHRLSIGTGYAHLFRGAFLRESKRCSATQPYIFVTYRF